MFADWTTSTYSETKENPHSSEDEIKEQIKEQKEDPAPTPAPTPTPTPTPAPSKRTRPVLEKLRDAFNLSSEFLRQNVMKGLAYESRRGLAGEDSTLKMLPTYVTDLPTGKETGVWRACAYLLASYNVLCVCVCMCVSRHLLRTGFWWHQSPRVEGL